MPIFKTAMITLQHSNGIILAQHKPIRLDPVNLPWNLEVTGLVPTDWFDCITLGWVSPMPIRSDYLIDEATDERYSMFSTVFKALTGLQFRVARYSGVTP